MDLLDEYMISGKFLVENINAKSHNTDSLSYNSSNLQIKLIFS